MRWPIGLLAGAVMAIVVTGVVALLDPPLPALSLLVLYLLPVLAVAVRWGAGPAAVGAVLSTVLYGFLFTPPHRDWWVTDSRDGIALVVFLVTAVVVGNLAARLRRAAQEAAGLSEEQAALRRVATQVANSAPPPEVFDTVAEEIGRVLGADPTVVVRLDPDGMSTVVAVAGTATGNLSVGGRGTLDPQLAVAEALRTGRRHGDLQGSVAMPVVVGGRIWGALVVGARHDRFPAGVEQRIAAFTELVATAVTNADTRSALRQMADEQAALRRVATLAARGAEQDRVLAAVAEEVGTLIAADRTEVLRFETDATATFVGGHGWPDGAMRRLGERRSLPASSVAAVVRETGRPARTETSDAATPPGERDDGLRWAVASPIVVAGRLWGVVTVASTSGPFAVGTEQRMADFTEIVASAIANAESRTELIASRARVIAAGDAIRRRLERDLHDGAQQRLVSLALELRQLQGAVEHDAADVGADLGRMAEDLTEALDELRELSRGIHPAILSEGGLGPALRTLARRAGLPVELDVRTSARFAERVEVAAYYVVTEAVTNTTKHAGASHVEVILAERDARLWLRVRDDGVGGAEPLRGSGLTGVRDRVEAIGGSVYMSSPSGAGTLIEVSLPLAGEKPS